MDDRNNAKVIKAFVPLIWVVWLCYFASELYLLVELLLLWSSRDTNAAPTNIAEEVIVKARG